MANELTKPLDLQTVMRDRVRAVIMDSLPDEQLDKLLAAEKAAFFTTPTGYYTQAGQQTFSPFARMVHDEFKAQLGERIKEFVAREVQEVDVQDLVVGEGGSVIARIRGEALNAIVTGFANNIIAMIQAGAQSKF